MASSSTTCTSDNNKNQTSLEDNSACSSLENFLFLPQLPVDGDDLGTQFFPRYKHENEHEEQQLLSPRSSFQTLFTYLRPSSITTHTNHQRNGSLDHSHSSCGKLGHSAANDTVIASELSGVKSHFSSSMSIFIRNAETCNHSGGYNHSPFSLPANHHHHHKIRLKSSRFLLFRICQTLLALLCFFFLLHLVKTLAWRSENDAEYNVKKLASRLSQNRLIQSWNMPSILPLSGSFKLPEIHATTSTGGDFNDEQNLLLLDIPNFSFLLDNKTKCLTSPSSPFRDSNGVGDSSENTIFFMIIVHSAPQNAMERQVIRDTWGSLQRLGQFHVRLVFLLGNDINPDEHPNRNHHHRSTSFAKILRESQEFGDIVAGNFHDSYRNLTYKHLMGYKWVLSHCPDKKVKFVLKCDDDVFMDIFQLYDFLLRTFGKEPDAALICNVFPEGTKPVRKTDTQGKKWAVTYEEYPYDSYPKYCGGLAYLATLNVIREIYRMSENMQDKYLWIDDVYVTGILRELAHVEPFYLNLRYSYDPEEYRKWLAMPLNSSLGGSEKDERSDNSSLNITNEKSRAPPPSNKIRFMIVHLERGPQLPIEMQMLWNKTRIVWSDSGLVT